MKKAGLALLAAAAIGAGAAAITWGATGDSPVIHACVSRGSDLVRIPATGEACRPHETAVDWNAQGPAGPPGPPGPKGDTGAAGAGAADPNTRVVGYLRVQSPRLGTIDGESTAKGHENWIEVLGFDEDTTAPTSIGSAGGGAGAGKIELKPLVITKRIDKATPKLFQALVTNDALGTVQLDLVRPDGAGGEETYYTVKLTNAIVSDDHQLDAGKSGGHAVEQLSFVFQRIEISEGGSTASTGGGPSA